METIENQPRDEGESHDDRRLVEELENLYYQVARLDQLDASADSMKELHPSQNISEVHPTGNLSGFNPPEEPFKVRRYSNHNPPCRDELIERLNKIRDAYEKMLTYWPYASGDSPMSSIVKKT